MKNQMLNKKIATQATLIARIDKDTIQVELSNSVVEYHKYLNRFVMQLRIKINGSCWHDAPLDGGELADFIDLWQALETIEAEDSTRAHNKKRSDARDVVYEIACSLNS